MSTEDRARAGRRAEVLTTAAFLVAGASGVALTIVYALGGQPQLEGLLLGVIFGGLAVGFVTWARHLMPQGPFIDERHHLASPPIEELATESDFARAGVLTRRRAIVRALGFAIAAVGAAAAVPIRSLGPRPGTSLLRTPWRRGLRLVTEDGRPVRADEVPRDGLVTVFPEGHPGSADGQAVLIRVETGRIVPLPGRKDWSPNGLVAYSKICTHAGCPVGLYAAESQQLLCPCHQSTFDVLRHARPVFGPAAAPLPQLPLRIEDGFVVADGDFSAPVGPAFWRRG